MTTTLESARRIREESPGQVTDIPGAYVETIWRKPVLQGNSPFYDKVYSVDEKNWVPPKPLTAIEKANEAIKLRMPHLFLWAPVALGAYIGLLVFVKTFL